MLMVAALRSPAAVASARNTRIFVLAGDRESYSIFRQPFHAESDVYRFFRDQTDGLSSKGGLRLCQNFNRL